MQATPTGSGPGTDGRLAVVLAASMLAAACTAHEDRAPVQTSQARAPERPVPESAPPPPERDPTGRTPDERDRIRAALEHGLAFELEFDYGLDDDISEYVSATGALSYETCKHVYPLHVPLSPDARERIRRELLAVGFVDLHEALHERGSCAPKRTWLLELQAGGHSKWVNARCDAAEQNGLGPLTRAIFEAFEETRAWRERARDECAYL